MENASKALLMAGSILIAILIIALLVESFSNVSSFQRAQLSEEEQAQILAFNEQYTKYLGQYVYGTEVASVINRTVDYNKENTPPINVSITFKQPYSYRRGNKEYTTKQIEINTNDFLLKGSENIKELNSRAFKCTNIGYSSYGKVSSITFEEKEWNN